MQTAGDIFAACVHDQALDVKEQVFATAVEWDAFDLILRYRIERGADGMGVGRRYDALRR